MCMLYICARALTWTLRECAEARAELRPNKRSAYSDELFLTSKRRHTDGLGTNRIWSRVPTGNETKNNCAVEDQWKFTAMVLIMKRSGKGKK
jgi:hypothetical protein